MSGNAAPDPTILKREAREVQERAITACHPQLELNNHPCSYTLLSTGDYLLSRNRFQPS